MRTVEAGRDRWIAALEASRWERVRSQRGVGVSSSALVKQWIVETMDRQAGGGWSVEICLLWRRRSIHVSRGGKEADVEAGDSGMCCVGDTGTGWWDGVAPARTLDLISSNTDFLTSARDLCDEVWIDESSPCQTYGNAFPMAFLIGCWMGDWPSEAALEDVRDLPSVGICDCARADHGGVVAIRGFPL